MEVLPRLVASAGRALLKALLERLETDRGRLLPAIAVVLGDLTVEPALRVRCALPWWLVPFICEQPAALELCLDALRDRHHARLNVPLLLQLARSALLVAPQGVLLPPHSSLLPALVQARCNAS